MKLGVPRSIVAIGILTLLPLAWAQNPPLVTTDINHRHTLVLTSTTFSNNGTIPLSMVWNQCTAYPGGANQSPELS